MLKQDKYHNSIVWVNIMMDELRKTECLCLNCKDIKDCEIASKLYGICVNNDIATMITRCKIFTLK